VSRYALYKGARLEVRIRVTPRITQYFARKTSNFPERHGKRKDDFLKNSGVCAGTVTGKRKSQKWLLTTRDGDKLAANGYRIGLTSRKKQRILWSTCRPGHRVSRGGWGTALLASLGLRRGQNHSYRTSHCSQKGNTLSNKFSLMSNLTAPGTRSKSNTGVEEKAEIPIIQ